MQYTIAGCDTSHDGGYGRVYNLCKAALNATEVHGKPFLLVDSPFSMRHSIVRLTMWDTTAVPPEYDFWGCARAFIVPNKANAIMFRKYTRKPIHVLPLFADTSYTSIPQSGPFRFLCVARSRGMTECKGIAQLIRCFTKAFGDDPNVELIIKQSHNCREYYTIDRRITFNRETLSRADYHKLIHSAHCGVFLSGYEGWNLPLCELMAAGRPSIAIKFLGPADFFDDKVGYELPFKLERAPKDGYLGAGFGAKAQDAGVVSALREAYSDKLTLAEKGIAGARRAMDYTETRFAARLQNIVCRYTT